MRKKQHLSCGFSSIWQVGLVKRLEDGQISRRERQVMDILFRLGKATAEEVLNELPDPPSYSAVRALLVTLEGKGLVKHGKESRKYVYQPTVPEKKAKRTALKQLIATFFEGSPEKLVASLLDPQDQKLSAEEIGKIRKLIDAADGK
ncbi:MAG: BlaI/MecI/CopY family transcriptional regulator [Verrucomicrobiaceae bacterium]|nr:MAG: BlaI/MecI/CopY family transcriptional regulator [Verrucomicrobiaceae bacterium]